MKESREGILMDHVIFGICVAIVLFGMLALEARRLVYSVVFLWASAVSVGLLFWYVGAWYAAILQWLVYAGVLVILFLTTVSFTEKAAPEA
ncbi:MAG: NADH-quinone oxidoreductase subunit J [Candidatus Hodarchaeales archaeon]